MDKISGMFMGGAIGDALGAPHEFRYHKSNEYTGLLHHNFKFLARYQPVRHAVAGQTTDDTEMTLALANSLIDNKGYDKNGAILSYEKWANDAKFLGVNTRLLFKGVKTVKGYESRYGKVFDTPEKRHATQSNGSMMRCSPLVFIFDNNVVVTDCKLTNPSPINLDANLIYINAMRLLVMGHDRYQTFNTVMGLSQTPEVRNVLSDVSNRVIRDVTGKSKGWVLHALYCAFWGLLYSENYQDMIDYIIRLGGDTDTNAAIAGSLLGVMYGYNVLLLENRTRYNMNMVLACDTNQGDFPRESKYTMGPPDKFVKFVQDFHDKVAVPNFVMKK